MYELDRDLVLERLGRRSAAELAYVGAQVDVPAAEGRGAGRQGRALALVLHDAEAGDLVVLVGPALRVEVGAGEEREGEEVLLDGPAGVLVVQVGERRQCDVHEVVLWYRDAHVVLGVPCCVHPRCAGPTGRADVTGRWVVHARVVHPVGVPRCLWAPGEVVEVESGPAVVLGVERVVGPQHVDVNGVLA